MFVSHLKTILILLMFTLISGFSIAQSSQEETTTSQYEPEEGWGNYFVDKVNSGDAEHIAIAINLYRGDINAYNRDGNSALHVAVKNRYSSTVRFLLANGADPNLPTAVEGNTPLILAAIFSTIEELAQGIDSSTNSASNTVAHNLPIHPTNIIHDLLYLGRWLGIETANPNSTNSLGQTPLEIAVRNNSFNLANSLLNAGANPNIEVQDEHGNTTTIRDMLSQKVGLM